MTLALPAPRSPIELWNQVDPGINSFGATVTHGANSSMGSWLDVVEDTSVTEDVVGFGLLISSASASTVANPKLTEIGIDPAGGTSYSAIVGPFVAGQIGAFGSPTMLGSVQNLWFPLRIPSGAQIGIRGETGHTSTVTARYLIRLYRSGAAQHGWRTGSYCEIVGATSSSLGVAFTPGTDAWGSWTSLGTTSKDLWHWQVTAQTNDATLTSTLYTRIQLAVGDGSSYTVVSDQAMVSSSSEELGMMHEPPPQAGYFPVPAGSTMYVRGFNLSVAPNSGWNATAIGVGG